MTSPGPEREVNTDDETSESEPGSESGDSLSDVTIRRAERADLLEVLGIEKTCFTEPWPYTAFESFLDEPGFLVAVNEGNVVGYIVADVMPNHGRDLGHIKDIAVTPEARGIGLGRRLLQRGLVSLSFSGAALVKLEVRVGNEPALSLYRKMGFEPARRVPSYYADGEDALLMVLDVDAWQD
ncbi:(SSU ribosomal protein s18p)-alanine acetyltransferase [Halogeometricum borinquense DSM 11551]|uniref:(SSU ribosomal protein S18P)-alanine acetyltransferase n=1 Tax=Halogeometricum borinquense (strain ATCC 700274 / DSM 11551 / JCM 10706 / KCTC 4070 / PR3) TaxID=469382 RepID=E4NM50_HALBP|nr:(SSU ribosomal protein S18P)-alanine acetyltransferase [Halogeometricum borinquense DSM 11551]ELY27356.1 (SSU ribosomal protein s18p)-alanine acetyltransferase [Halogeometricum borinquense DSM 11551]